MALKLKTITFNHNPADPTVSALNIRRNKDFEVLVPEYDIANPRPAVEQCAAYAIAPTTAQVVTVALSFGIGQPAQAAFEVKASGGGVLGALAPFPIAFNNTAQATAAVPLSARQFNAIGRHDVSWDWQYREKGTVPWHPLVTTSHRIYILLDLPPAPWSQAFADKRNPWTDLLDECCAVAGGTKTPENATRAVARRIHLGYALKYDIQSGADRYDFVFTGMQFNLTDWIDFVIRGNAPTLPKFCSGGLHEYPDFMIVNCYDCAASLGLMSKVLGAPVDYHFHNPFGYLRYVLPIGRGKCNNPFPGCLSAAFALGPDDARSHFGNHAYTKLSGATNFDACMREWVPLWCAILYLLLWLIVLILTFGTVNLQGLRDRAEGWLFDLSQATYNQRTIDISQPFEAAAAGGVPSLQVLDFQIA
ncbi:MAG: hypothetical protein ABI647_12280 [Gemmatimonadota bacterium]